MIDGAGNCYEIIVMKRMWLLVLMGSCFLSAVAAMAAQDAEAAHLASGASSAAYKSHPILMTMAHVVFILVLVSSGAALLRTLISPRIPRR